MSGFTNSIQGTKSMPMTVIRQALGLRARRVKSAPLRIITEPELELNTPMTYAVELPFSPASLELMLETKVSRAIELPISPASPELMLETRVSRIAELPISPVEPEIVHKTVDYDGTTSRVSPISPAMPEDSAPWRQEFRPIRAESIESSMHGDVESLNPLRDMSMVTTWPSNESDSLIVNTNDINSVAPARPRGETVASLTASMQAMFDGFDGDHTSNHSEEESAPYSPSGLMPKQPTSPSDVYGVYRRPSNEPEPQTSVTELENNLAMESMQDQVDDHGSMQSQNMKGKPWSTGPKDPEDRFKSLKKRFMLRLGPGKKSHGVQ